MCIRDRYWRIEPLPEDCQELTEKYISGLSYVNYNLLVTDWDSSNVEAVSYTHLETSGG